MSDPDCGLGAIKAGLDDVKKSVGDGKKKVAAAITEKGVTTAADSAFDTLAANIGKIVTLSSGSADANATAAQILSGYSAYVKGAKVNGSMPSLGAQTITPGTAAKTIAAGRYLSGLQTIAGDANLVAANIKKGVSIFGVLGNYESVQNLKYGELQTMSTSSAFIIQPQTIQLDFVPHIVFLFIRALKENTTNSPDNRFLLVGLIGKGTGNTFSNASIFSVVNQGQGINVGNVTLDDMKIHPANKQVQILNQKGISVNSYHNDRKALYIAIP